MSEQQAKEAGPDKACCEPAKQSAAEEARPSRRLPDCVTLRWIGAAVFGAVRVTGGAEKVRTPRLPPEDPPPARALASAATRMSAAAIAAAAIRKRRRNIALSPPETWR